MIAATGFGLVVSPLAMIPAANAAPDGSKLVISEVYGGGGNSGATLKSDFIELYNPTTSPISLDGMSLQYRSATATTQPTIVFQLSGSVPANGHWLVKAADGAGGTDELPTPDQSSTISMGGTGGQVFLADQTTPLTLSPVTGEMAGQPGVVDMVGFGSGATSFEAAQTGTVSNTTAAS